MKWYPLKFDPIYRRKVWGGRAMEDKLGRYLPTGQPIGESLEIADLGEGSTSVAANGGLAGMSLREIIVKHGAEFLGDASDGFAEKFGLVYKILDVQGDFSVQVHPTDEDADSKTEGWYVMSASPTAYVIAGCIETTTRDVFEQLLNRGRLTSCLNRLGIAAGDAFYLPGGTLHAAGGGALIYEIQQASDTTWRVWDYDRPGLDGNPRELHIDKALAAISYEIPVAKVMQKKINDEPATNRVFDSPRFKLDSIEALAPFELRLDKNLPYVVTLISGKGRMAGDFDDVELKRADTVMLGAAIEGVRFEPEEAGRILLSHPVLNM